MTISEEVAKIDERLDDVRERLIAVEGRLESHEDADVQRHAEGMAGQQRIERQIGRFGLAMLGVVVLSMMINGALVGVSAGVSVPTLGRITVGEAAAAQPAQPAQPEPAP